MYIIYEDCSSLPILGKLSFNSSECSESQSIIEVSSLNDEKSTACLLIRMFTFFSLTVFILIMMNLDREKESFCLLISLPEANLHMYAENPLHVYRLLIYIYTCMSPSCFLMG